MNRQKASHRMFGLAMLTVALLLVACGGDSGDPTPTATSDVNAAVPTLPASVGTAEAQTTQDISEEDLTVVTPDLPTDLTGTPDSGTPTETSSVATAVETEVATVMSTSESTAGVVDGTQTGTSEGTPAPAEAVTDTASSTPGAVIPTGNETHGSPGDGTGGSGQPGERSSNLPAQATPFASPVAELTVEGCDVPNVPAFTGSTTEFVTVAEVNFRSGPGTECEPILATPLPEALAVTVLGGPVMQAGDETQWLQIEVDGVPGWVSLEFVEPAE